ncbi:MAG: radical SAM protein [Lachnospiraceae bacterium]|nr:radical SAM protein [Lachnospiraceae bacterium]
MENKEFNLGEYLTRGVEGIVRRAVRATFTDPRESAFMARFALLSREASRRRAKAETEGENIPPFLIASITSSCNLHCAGCYSRQNHACTDAAPVNQLTAKDWENVFSEARELGISFILLAGGEPLLRRDVINAAGNYPEIMFPIFTNGTLLNDEYIKLFDRKRNLLPVLSIEGRQEKTDERRGGGVYASVKTAMEQIRKNRLIFGASVTVTTANLQEVTGREFLDELRDGGCKAVIYVEFVPVTEESKGLAPGDAEREYLRECLSEIREEYPDMVFISFPGDEKGTGGCLAAGRGFFHINSHGGAEPCPFSPYSDINVKNTSLRQALHSPLFTALREQNVLMEEHSGGCVLFERKESVEALLAESAGKTVLTSAAG